MSEQPFDTSASRNELSEQTPEQTLKDAFWETHNLWTYEWVYSSAFRTPIERSDIYLCGWENLRKRLFDSGGKAKHVFNSADDERKFIKQVLRNANIDLIRRRNREAKFLRLITLDEPLESLDDNSLTLADTVEAPGDFTSDIDDALDRPQIVKDIRAAVDAIPNEKHRLVALADLGHVDEMKLKLISEGCIRVARSRYRKYLRRLACLAKYKDQTK